MGWIGSGRRSLAAVLLAVLAIGGAVAPDVGARTTALHGRKPSVLPVGPLRSDGRFLIDRQNRVVILHGLFGSWKIPGVWAPPDSSTDPAGFTFQDAQHIAALGLDGFRLAYFWEGLQPSSPTVYDASYLADIGRVEHDLAENGIFTVIDSHQDMYSDVFGGDGFPTWSVHNNGLPLGYNLGFPVNYFTPAVSTAFDNFWLDTGGVLGQYEQQLAHVARYFADDPMVVGYDLINEPWPGSQYPTCAQPVGCPAFDTALLQPAENAFANAVRQADPNHILFYEPNFFFDAGVRSWLSRAPADLGQVGLSFHDECLTRAVVQSGAPDSGSLAPTTNEICPTTNQQVLENALATAWTLGGTPLETEVAPASNSDYAGLNCLLELDDQNMVGWFYGLSWRSGELRDLDPTKAEVLTRSYPRAIAGTPLSYGFDPRTGDFQLEYRPSPRAHGPTVVELPPAVYPNGYSVSVTGARQTSLPGAELLTLSNLHSANTVTLSVTPNAGATPITRPSLPACPSGVQSGLPISSP